MKRKGMKSVRLVGFIVLMNELQFYNKYNNISFIMNNSHQNLTNNYFRHTNWNLSFSEISCIVKCELSYRDIIQYIIILSL